MGGAGPPPGGWPEPRGAVWTETPGEGCATPAHRWEGHVSEPGDSQGLQGHQIWGDRRRRDFLPIHAPGGGALLSAPEPGASGLQGEQRGRLRPPVWGHSGWQSSGTRTAPEFTQPLCLCPVCDCGPPNSGPCRAGRYRGGFRAGRAASGPSQAGLCGSGRSSLPLLPPAAPRPPWSCAGPQCPLSWGCGRGCGGGVPGLPALLPAPGWPLRQPRSPEGGERPHLGRTWAVTTSRALGSAAHFPGGSWRGSSHTQ